MADALPAVNHQNLVQLRRQFHAIPEVSFNEQQTAAKIATILAQAGLQVTTGVGQTGVVATVSGTKTGSKPDKTLMIRADIDGLPIVEKTGLEFAATNGAMHACGHDGHIAIALATASILQARAVDLNGQVVFVFQPSEESSQGALAMLQDGLIERYRPDRVVGLHIWNQLEAGKIAVNQHLVFASADIFRLTITGRGGHGALPHLTIDPVVITAAVINACQTIVARELAPSEMGVVTFGSIAGGSVGNVIADSVVMEGTVRAFTPGVRDTILAALPRVAAATAEGLRGKAHFEHLFGTPPVINDTEVAAWVSGIAAAVVGEQHVSRHEPISVGDDMAEFLNRIPGTYFLLGASKSGTEGHHNARFDFDEACLPYGVNVFVECALDYLSR